MSARKGGGGLGRRRAADQARAAYMAAKGVKRTTFRDPITNEMRAVGSYPGTVKGKSKEE